MLFLNKNWPPTFFCDIISYNFINDSYPERISMSVRLTSILFNYSDDKSDLAGSQK